MGGPSGRAQGSQKCEKRREKLKSEGNRFHGRMRFRSDIMCLLNVYKSDENDKDY